jgi:DNA mismatch repair ATPase MutS
MQDKMKDRYLKRADGFRLLELKEEKILLALSILRLCIFAGGIFLIWLGFTRSLIAGFLLIPVLVILFLYLLKLYSYHSEIKVFLAMLVLVNQNEAEAVSGNLSAFEAGNEYADPHHNFSNDVDLFGNNSLFQYLNRTVTGYGRDILASWLSDPFTLTGELILRQEAIKELALKEEWRHRFMASGMKKPLEKINIDGLIGWLNDSPVIKSTFLKRVLIYFLPSAAVFSLLLVSTGVIHFKFFAFIFLINLLVVAAGLKKTNNIHRQVTGVHNYLSSIYQLLKIFDNETFTSSLLDEVKRNISGSTVSAAVSVKKLTSLIQAFDSRLNIIVSFILNGLLLWDYHCIFRLENWKSEYRSNFPLWIEMVGKIDAFNSLGNYSFNNPGFVYPVISEKKCLFSVTSAGHPLINENKRVCNDFVLARAGTVCIISGANMSGKSTFLRTIAVNYILGMAGAPVCAAEMAFTPLKLFTSMRTTDSLSDNESYFYAELKRLKMLKSEIERGEPVLFILDEILKGTNSADKSLGSKLFMKRIVELGGTGLIATHDITLGEMEKEYPGVVINKCFEIEIEGDTIRFDYILQNGITHKMNAAILMKQMGILE